MVITGWALGDIASHIQTIRGESMDITPDALVWALGEYRKDLPPGTLVQKTLPQVFTQAAKQVSEGLDTLAEMERLYKLQMARVDIDYAVEQKIGKLMPNMAGEIRTAKDILESYAELQMDLGLVDRHLGKVDVEAASLTGAAGNYGKEAVKKVIENPQSRRKLLGLVERFLVVQNEREKLPESPLSDAEAVALDQGAEPLGEPSGQEPVLQEPALQDPGATGEPA